MRGLGGNLPPELANLLKDDSLSPFEDPNFQQLMSMVAATQPPGEAGGAAPPGARGPAPTSNERRAREKAAKRKADTSLETWMDMSKGLDLSLPGMGQGGPVAPLETL
jgi:hypothetical protein